MFFMGLIAEGLADFFRYSYNGKIIFNEKYFKNIKKEAISSAKNLKANFENFLAKPELNNYRKSRKMLFDFMEELSEVKYIIGEFLVYSIVFFEVRDGKNEEEIIEKLMILKYGRFLQWYEKISIVNNQKPLVTFASSKGIIDYKRMLAELAATFKKIREK